MYIYNVYTCIYCTCIILKMIITLQLIFKNLQRKPLGIKITFITFKTPKLLYKRKNTFTSYGLLWQDKKNVCSHILYKLRHCKK